MTETTVASADGTTLLARRTGDGTPLVLVHGGNGDIDTFARITPALAERHTVWTYSRRGRGGSGDGPDYRGEREVEDVLAVVAAAGGDAHLFGHSGGASMCLLAAGRAPSLRSLVLYEPPLAVERFDTRVIDEVEAALAVDDPDKALELFFPWAGIIEPEVQILRALAPVWERLRQGVRLVPRELRAAIGEAPEQLASFVPPAVPTLYLYGEENTSPMFSTLDEVAALLPKARLRGLPGQRHLAWAFDPTTFVDAVLGFTAAHD